MTYVIVSDETAKRLTGNPTLTSLDGEERGTFGSIRDSSPERLAEFGVYDVDTAPPEGQRWTGQFDGTVTPPVAVFEMLDPVEELAKERAAMSCSPLQGKLALGEETWGLVEAMLADPETPFAMRIAITSAIQWDRTSQMMDELAWIMDLTPEQVDDLFRAAMQIAI